MNEMAALCIDEACCHDPSLVGLAGESLDRQSWLHVFSSGAAARGFLANSSSIQRVWVVSSDDVEPINLAATLKADRPDLFVSLVDPELCGSVLSRAHTALIDEVITLSVFTRQYGEMKGRASIAYPASGAIDLAVDKTPAEVVRPGVTSKVAAESPAAADGKRDGAAALSIPAETRPTVTSIAATTGVARKQAFVMPVVSGSGGAGKSTVSVVAAHTAHKLGYRTLLLDYDLQFGDVSVLSGTKDPFRLDRAIERPDLVGAEVGRSDGLVVVAAPERLEMAELVIGAMPAFLESMSALFDVIIANTGAAWAEQHAVLLERSNIALFLIDQRASSIRACRHAYELCARCGIATGPFRFVVNRCAKGAPLNSVDVSTALRGVPVFEIKNGGRDVEDYLSAGRILDLMDSKNDLCISLEQLLSRLLPGAERAAPTDQMSSGRGQRKGGWLSTRKRGVRQ